jgi:NAD-dependent DNA ligase
VLAELTHYKKEAIMSHAEFDNITRLKLTELFKYKSSQQDVQAIIDRGFVAAEFKEGKALFIGINPSFTSEAKNESYLYDIDRAINEYPKHYKHFSDLLKETKYENDWTYIDLFQFRETNQKNINLFFKSDIQFIVEQLRLSHSIISKINPEIIIVCNTGAANFFGIDMIEKDGKLDSVWFGYDFIFDERYGVDIIKERLSESIIENNDEILTNTAVLFTGTLTYMSRFDKRRLNWQIKSIGNKINMGNT